MPNLTRDEILAGMRKTRKVQVENIPGLGDLAIWELSGKQQIELAKWVKSVAPDGAESANVLDLVDYRERVLQMALCGEDGQPLFALDEIPKLAEFGAHVLNRLFEVASDLSGLNEQAIERKANDLPNSPGASAS